MINSVFPTLLASLGPLGSIVLKDDPTRRNIDFFPERPSSLERGTMMYIGAGGDRRLNPSRRLTYALIGPAATPLGLAELFVELIAPQLGHFLSPPTPLQAAGVLFEFIGWGTMEALANAWHVGALVPLPIQEVLGPPASWIAEWPAVPAAVSQTDPRLSVRSRNLEDADPLMAPGERSMDKLRERVRTQVLPPYLGSPPAKPLSDLARSLALRTLKNPYESLFTTIEVFRQLKPTGGVDRRLEALATDLVSALSEPQLEVIAATSAGQAILRHCFAVLPTGPAKDRVGGALNQPKDPAGAFSELKDARPGTVPREPPLSRELSTKATAGSPAKIMQFAMALGRRVCVGADVQTPYSNAVWTGPSITGETPPEDYYKTHDALIDVPRLGVAPARARERWNSRLRVVLPLALNEGNLEGLRMADKGLLSIGFQQWTFHVNEEGTVLLERFRAGNPVLFDVFFGSAGLETAICDDTGNPSASLEILAKHNPHAFEQRRQNPADPASPLVWIQKDDGSISEYYPAHVTLRGARPGERHQTMPASEMALEGADRRRFSFFGFSVAEEPTYDAKGNPTKKGKFQLTQDQQGWASRFRLALQTMSEWQPLQFHQAAYRFTRLQGEISLPIGSSIRAEDSFAEIPNWCGHSHRVAELLGSEFAATIGMDIFINGTGLAKAVIREAWHRTQAAYAAEGVAWNDLHEEERPPLPPKLKREVLFRFALALAGVRRAYGFDPDIRTTRALGMLDRQPNEVYRPNSGDFKEDTKKRQVKYDLFSVPGSFKGWD